MSTPSDVIGQIWLTAELATFFAVLLSNITFMLIRSCREVQIRFDTMDKKRQLPTADTLESLLTLI